MTKRLPVSISRVNYFDGMQVTRDTMVDDQSRHRNIDAAIVANFMGSGVVQHDTKAPVILDTDDLNTQQQALFDGYDFDGINVYTGSPLASPSDSTKGVQLAVELTNVLLEGAETTRISIIGETFDDSLIHDDLVFEENGIQVTRGRYKSFSSIMFSDFAGNRFGSRSPAVDDGYNFIGRCVIREAKAMEVSRDTIISAQNSQPNQFFDKFVPAEATKTINQVLQEAIGSGHSLSELNIGFSSIGQRSLASNDVVTRIGQKFLAYGTNIQKISVLLSVEEDITALPGHEYDWSGQIVMNIHALQAQVDCPVDPVPDNLVDFDPEPSVVSQLSLDSEDLRKHGIVLDGYARVVDFVFTGTNMAEPTRTPIELMKYYMLTIGRAGDASVGAIVLEEATHTSETGYMALFDGDSWTNIYESDMWYEIHGDYIKASDGISYQDGVGTEIPRLDTDDFGVETPFVKSSIPFYTSAKNTANFILVEVTSEFSDPLQDPRTGNNISSRVRPVPNISAISQSDLAELISYDRLPLVLAEAKDGNPRGNPSSITGTSNQPGLVYGNKIDVLDPDADLRNNNLVGSLLQPNTAASPQYRIIKQELFNDLYGDVDGDGKITIADVQEVNSWLPDGYDLSDPVDQAKIMAGLVSIEKVLRADVNGDGKVDATDAALILDYVSGTLGSFSAGGGFSRMRITVEELLNPLDANADIPAADSVFTTTPFAATPFKIDYIRTWVPDRLTICDMRRLVPTTFSDPPNSDPDECDGGHNDFLIPNDVVIAGNMLNTDGNPYSIDMEMTHLSMIIPVTDSSGNPIFLDGYLGINLFDTFIAESSNGKTPGGFDAMKFSDGTYVQMSDFSEGRVRIAVAIQSHSNTFPVPFGTSVEDIVGVNYDAGTSLLTLWMKNLYGDGYGNIPPALDTKILATVFLKKAGFVNTPQVISSDQVRALFNL